MRRSTAAAAAALSLAVVGLAAPAVQARQAPERTVTVDKSVMGTRVSSHASRQSSAQTISYHRGPVLTASTGVAAYYIWYGSWADSSKAIITDFGISLGGSPYFNINTTYYDGAGRKVVNKVTLAGQTVAPYTKGNALSDAQIQQIVGESISSGSLPADPNGIYVVLTAPGITETSGFLTQYCGWHTHATLSGQDVKYAFVGDAAGPSLGNCAWQTTASPNGDPGADALVSVLAHEIEEATTDPDLNAWYDRRGNENADKCAWTFGTTYSAAGGGIANMRLGSRDFLVQQNWKAGSSQGCALSYP
ncbi:MAG: hypothetical protein GC157_11675 [Frankiales bacterium]|nr:hypothetical protein [Frankiales bacterium]